MFFLSVKEYTHDKSSPCHVKFFTLQNLNLLTVKFGMSNDPQAE